MIRTLFNKKKDFISCDEARRRMEARRNAYKPMRNKVNVVTGLLCIAYGGVTILLPTGSIWAMSLGIFLISCPLSIRSLAKGLYDDIKFYIGVKF